MSAASPGTRHGDVLSAISDGLVALLKEFYGRGPTQAKSYYVDDMVVPRASRASYRYTYVSPRDSTARTSTTTKLRTR